MCQSQLQKGGTGDRTCTDLMGVENFRNSHFQGHKQWEVGTEVNDKTLFMWALILE